MVLIVPETAPEDLGVILESELGRLATAQQLQMEVQPTLNPSSVTSETQLVVFLSSTGGRANESAISSDEIKSITDLAVTHRDIQFLAIGVPGLITQDNISAIDLNMSTPAYQGFLAGYLAAVVTDEWRVGAITTDDADGLAFRQGFLNGVIFFCGLCQPTYPPFSGYPLAESLPQNSPPVEWQAAANTLIDRAVKTVFIAPGAGDTSLMELLARSGLFMIATSPPPPEITDQWVATISIDLTSTLATILPELIAGHGGLTFAPDLELTNINEQVLTPGRQRLIEDIIREIQGGLVDPGVDIPPSTP